MRTNRLRQRALALASLTVVSGCVTDSTAPDPAPRPGGMSGPHTSLVTMTTVVIKPSAMNGWGFLAEGAAGSTGSMVSGPAGVPSGTGSAQLTLSASNQSHVIGAAILQGTPLSTLDRLQYSGYRQSTDAGNNLAVALQFNVDYDLTDGSTGWQGRLVFEPYLLGGGGSVLEDVWQTWDAIGGATGGWFSTGNPVVNDLPALKPCTMATPCTWQEVIDAYPDIGVHASAGAVLFKAGSGWAPFTGNVDQLIVGTPSGETTYDFEPDTQWGDCVVDDDGASYTLLADCTTDQTLVIPDGYTLYGNGFTITAVDPAGGHFLGAVVRNGGSTADVSGVTITASGLVNTCDGAGPPDTRLRGILFEGASGTITNNVVTNVNQGPSGCQEGNAIEVRKAPFDNTGSDVVVTISGNTVNGYIKNGITANGSVAATITNNVVTGSGPIGEPLAAQNGIQVGFGATAIVKGNTVSGNNYTPASWVACGILMYQADGVKASQNALSGNERDNCNYGKGGGNYNPNP